MENVLNLSPLVMATVPVIVALVQGAKQMGLPGKFAPVASMVFGIGLVFLTGPAGWTAVAVQGILAGLAASGLYSGGKAVVATPSDY